MYSSIEICGGSRFFCITTKYSHVIHWSQQVIYSTHHSDRKYIRQRCKIPIDWRLLSTSLSSRTRRGHLSHRSHFFFKLPHSLASNTKTLLPARKFAAVKCRESVFESGLTERLVNRFRRRTAYRLLLLLFFLFRCFVNNCDCIPRYPRVWRRDDTRPGTVHLSPACELEKCFVSGSVAWKFIQDEICWHVSPLWYQRWCITNMNIKKKLQFRETSQKEKWFSPKQNFIMNI